MTPNLSGKAAVVTGSSRGIGRAIALGLASCGASVAVSYLKNDQLAGQVVATIQEHGGTAVAVQADLSRPAEVTALFDRAEQELGPLDIVFANAAELLTKPVVECTEADYERIFAVNVKGTFFTLQEAARRVRAGGRIIATSTCATRMFFSEVALYAGSKGAVEQFVRVLSRELGPRNVTVNALSPGRTNTDMSSMAPTDYDDIAAKMSPFGRIGQPADIADIAVFLASDEARWITGQNIAASGGVS